MSSHRAQSFSVELRPSRRLLYWVLAVHAAALAVLPGLPLPWMAGGAIWLALSATHALYPRGATHWRRPPLRLSFHPDGNVEWESGATSHVARVLPQSLRLPWLCVIAWQGEHGRGRIVLAGDMLDAESFRRVRVWLRLIPPGHSAGAG